MSLNSLFLKKILEKIGIIYQLTQPKLGKLSGTYFLMLEIGKISKKCSFCKVNPSLVIIMIDSITKIGFSFLQTKEKILPNQICKYVALFFFN